MQPILELRNIVKHYGAVEAVTGVSLSIPQGSFFALLGASGCGKTTTLRLIAGFDQLTSGEIWLAGERIDALPAHQRDVNTVFQNYALFPHLNVRGNVEFGLRQRGAGEIAQKVNRILDQVRLQGKDSRKPSELSGGERQRVALARALVLAPQLLLLDEPLSALDPQLRTQVRSELKQLQRESGVTFLMVTHDQEDALGLSDQLAIMNAGRIEQMGTPEQLYLSPESRYVASFLGDMNWIDGKGIRPEAVRLGTNGTGQPGAIISTLFLGAYSEIEILLDAGGRCVARHPLNGQQNGQRYIAGQRVSVCWDAADEIRFA
jgi:ABC-type Fe3+/spermidine/putrescine transport system ATPase subunit